MGVRVIVSGSMHVGVGVYMWGLEFEGFGIGGGFAVDVDMEVGANKLSYRAHVCMCINRQAHK